MADRLGALRGARGVHRRVDSPESSVFLSHYQRVLSGMRDTLESGEPLRASTPPRTRHGVRFSGGGGGAARYAGVYLEEEEEEEEEEEDDSDPESEASVGFTAAVLREEQHLKKRKKKKKEKEEEKRDREEESECSPSSARSSVTDTSSYHETRRLPPPAAEPPRTRRPRGRDSHEVEVAALHRRLATKELELAEVQGREQRLLSRLRELKPSWDRAVEERDAALRRAQARHQRMEAALSQAGHELARARSDADTRVARAEQRARVAEAQAEELRDAEQGWRDRTGSENARAAVLLRERDLAAHRLQEELDAAAEEAARCRHRADRAEAGAAAREEDHARELEALREQLDRAAEAERRGRALLAQATKENLELAERGVRERTAAAGSADQAAALRVELEEAHRMYDGAVRTFREREEKAVRIHAAAVGGLRSRLEASEAARQASEAALDEARRSIAALQEGLANRNAMVEALERRRGAGTAAPAAGARAPPHRSADRPEAEQLRERNEWLERALEVMREMPELHRHRRLLVAAARDIQGLVRVARSSRGSESVDVGALLDDAAGDDGAEADEDGGGARLEALLEQISEGASFLRAQARDLYADRLGDDCMVQ